MVEGVENVHQNTELRHWVLENVTKKDSMVVNQNVETIHAW